MSKRCCAASCYNCVATNRSVEYFGFPKSQEYATAWAKAAGREDLLEKNINNIIKYFLCSEHFADDCFLDAPHNRKLKKTSRPVVYPIPTIFHNNFDECVSKSLKEEKRTMKTVADERNSLLLNGTDEALVPAEPIDSRESIVLEPGHINVDTTTTTEMMEPMLVTMTTQMHDFLDTEENHLEEHEETLGEVVRFDVDVKEEIDRIDIEEQDGPQPNAGDCSYISEIVIGPMNCRLCLAAKENELLIPIFDDGSEVAYILDTLMPNTIKPDDGLPQKICLECLESVTRCLSTIEKFKSIQDRLKTLQ